MTRAASLEFHTADPALFRSEKSCSFSQTSSERPKSPQPTQENGGKPTLFKKPHQTAAFDTFGPCVRTHSDAQHLFIESTGLPSHPMMIGITAWQQQVPLPQFYTGANAWFQGSSGHLRVNVRAGGAVVEYVRAYLPSDESASRVNGSVSHRCEVLAR